MEIGNHAKPHNAKPYTALSFSFNLVSPADDGRTDKYLIISPSLLALFLIPPPPAHPSVRSSVAPGLLL